MTALQNLVDKIKLPTKPFFQKEMSQIGQNNQHKCHLCRNSYATLEFLYFHLRSFHGCNSNPSQSESQAIRKDNTLENLESKVVLVQPENDIDLDAIDSELAWLWNSSDNCKDTIVS